jgi:hypothetical protein
MARYEGLILTGPRAGEKMGASESTCQAEDRPPAVLSGPTTLATPPADQPVTGKTRIYKHVMGRFWIEADRFKHGTDPERVAINALVLGFRPIAEDPVERYQRAVVEEQEAWAAIDRRQRYRNAKENG